MTSFDVVANLRKITGIKKIGHAGTLDPLACGVLPICIGKNATKVLEFMTGMDKSYRAEMTLGMETDTMDSEGKITALSDKRPEQSEVEKAVRHFSGVIEQVPPMYSAVKYKGKKLYELARSGITVERKPRRAVISRIEILEITGDKVLFDVDCSSGTYIRTLCSDIGELLGCGAYMSFLVRTAAGPYKISSSFTLEEAAEAFSSGNTEGILMPPESALTEIRRFTVNDKEEKRFRNGVSILANEPATAGDIYRVCNEDGRLVGIGKAVMSYTAESMAIKPEKLFHL